MLVHEVFAITEKAPTRAFYWLKVPSSALPFQKLLRHHAKTREIHGKVDLGRREMYCWKILSALSTWRRP